MLASKGRTYADVAALFLCTAHRAFTKFSSRTTIIHVETSRVGACVVYSSADELRSTRALKSIFIHHPLPRTPSNPKHIKSQIAFSLQVTEVAYVESEGLHEVLSNQKTGGDKNGSSPGDFGLLPPAQEVLRLVASAERGSEHPLAKVRFPPPPHPTVMYVTTERHHVLGCPVQQYTVCFFVTCSVSVYIHPQRVE